MSARRFEESLALPTAMTALLGCQLLGELIVRALHLPIPGPVLGLLLLLAWLLLGTTVTLPVSSSLPEVARGLLNHMSLLFIPAGVGIILHGQTLADQWLPISVSLFGSTALALIATAVTFRAVCKIMERSKAKKEGGR
ncbi:murein hydrolase transporter LrgA [Rhodospirillum rubrum]|nr:murein hydrolase transporter LrgA [Rhodospirillum rubrum]MBK1677877.1 murein hydrolase transporter LrgA [Rhodospirillum rubrum]